MTIKKFFSIKIDRRTYRAHQRAFNLLVMFVSVVSIYLSNEIPKAFASQNLRGADLPPSISSSLVCADGVSDWCRLNALLALTVSDPQGYALTITGNAGWTISCSGSCLVNLPEGTGTAFYTVTAATSGLTSSGSIPWKYDPNPPVSNINISGTSGLNGWYVSAVNATAGGSDAISGLASAKLSVDGGAAVSSASIATDGVHSLNASVLDNAGNSDSSSASVKVDRTAPQVINNVVGTLGMNGWYVSNVTFKATYTDAASGIASVKYRLNAGAWQNGISVTVSTDGVHTVDFLATDNAGNQAMASRSIKIDKTQPILSITPTGSTGSNGWYVSNVSLSMLSNDNTSGVASSEYNQDGTGWLPFSSAITITDGSHNIQVRSTDAAGNQASASVMLNVDAIAPQVVDNVTGVLGMNGWYVSAVTIQAMSTDLTSSIASVKYKLDGGAWQVGASNTMALDGLHIVDFMVTDNAGNQTALSRSFKIDQSPPLLSLSPAGTAGSNNWYVSNVSLAMLSSDVTSGLTVFEYNQNGLGWTPFSSVVMLTDGEHTIQARAVDRAGNQATDSIMLQVDSVPPVQLLVLNGTAGLNNWYVSDVLAAVSASDLTSANVITTLTDNGAPAPIMLSDGVHHLQYVTVDAAGNSVSASTVVSIDSAAPITAFSAPAQNSAAMKTVSISGQSADLTSGLSETQISFDQVNWLALPLSNSNWSYAWDTAQIPNGTWSVFTRSMDWAGNTGSIAQLKVVLDNHPPFLSLSDTWNIWESGKLWVEENGIPLQNIKIVIHDPLQRYADQIIYDRLPAPTSVTWDRALGPANAPPGSYTVMVEVCDIYGVCAKDTGTILIPIESEPISFQLPVIEIPQWIPPIPFFIQTPAPEQPVAAPALVISTQLDVRAAPQSILNVVVISSFLAAFALLLLIDPRPAALRSLTRSFHQHIQHTKE